MLPGYMVQIPRFRAVEAEGATDVDLADWQTTFLLDTIDWDEQAGVARLAPENPNEESLAVLIEMARKRRRDEEQANWERFH